MQVASPKTAYLLLTIITFASPLAFGWTEPVKIVDNSFYPLELRAAAAVGETLYYVFVSDHYQAVCCGYSRDNGQTWSQPSFINDTSRHYLVRDPEIKYSKGFLHLLWSESTFHPQIWHSKSSDGGRNWSQPERVFNNVSSDGAFFPSLATNGDSLFLACAVVSNDGYSHQFIFFRSFDSGETWQDSMVIEPAPIGVGMWPYMLFTNGILHFIESISDYDDSLGFEIFYKRSSDAGLTWSDRIVLSPAELYPHPVDSQDASAAVDSSGHVLVAWMDYANGSMCGVSGDIFCRVSLDNGVTWQPWGSITNTQSGWMSSCLIEGDKYYATWNDYWQLGCDFAKEAVSVSSDSGFSWEPREFIADNIRSDDMNPILASTISQADSTIHCLFIRWSNDIDIAGIYYTRNRDFVGIKDDNAPIIPEAISLSAYPNPFNSSTIISFLNLKGDEIRIFDIKGSLVRILKHEQKKEGSIIWDATDGGGQKVSSGVYLVKASSQNNSLVIKLIYLK